MKKGQKTRSEAKNSRYLNLVVQPTLRIQYLYLDDSTYYEYYYFWLSPPLILWIIETTTMVMIKIHAKNRLQ